MKVRFELFVTDTEKSVAFYRDVLGFTELQSFGNYYPVKNGDVTIGIGSASGLKTNHYFQPEITSQRKGIGVEIVLEVDDVEALFEQVKKSGYPIAEELQQQEWGLRDFRLVDPDGYYLRITSKKIIYSSISSST